MIGSNEMSTLKIAAKPNSIGERLMELERFIMNYNNSMYSNFVAKDGGYCAAQG
jgi:hypothetical protein